MTGRGPQRRADDHVHPEYWHREEHYRFDDKIAKEIEGLRKDVEGLSSRLTLIFGGLALMAFLIPILAPIIRSWIGL